MPSIFRAKKLLVEIFDEGEASGVKLSAEAAEKRLRRTLPVEDFLPVSSIKSFFSRLSRGQGRSANEENIINIEIELDEILEDDEEEEGKMNKNINVNVIKITEVIDSLIMNLRKLLWNPT